MITLRLHLSCSNGFECINSLHENRSFFFYMYFFGKIEIDDNVFIFYIVISNLNILFYFVFIFFSLFWIKIDYICNTSVNSLIAFIKYLYEICISKAPETFKHSTHTKYCHGHRTFFKSNEWFLPFFWTI